MIYRKKRFFSSIKLIYFDMTSCLQIFHKIFTQVEFLTSEVSKRESEIYGLQSRLEMTEKQQQDQNHHISVLKEQVKARENKVTMLTADVSLFLCKTDIR